MFLFSHVCLWYGKEGRGKEGEPAWSYVCSRSFLTFKILDSLLGAALFIGNKREKSLSVKTDKGINLTGSSAERCEGVS